MAARKFTYTGDHLSDSSVLAVSEIIPQLILEQISAETQHMLLSREVLDRKQDVLLTARLALFLELSKEVKTRDALVLKYENLHSLKKEIEEEDKKIAVIRKRIDDNLTETEENEKKAMPEVTREENGLPAVPDHGMHPVKPMAEEPVAVYKDSPSELFTLSDESAGVSDYSGYVFKKAIADAKINGLITGSVVSYGGYAAVTVELHIYPGASSGGIVTEVGLVSEPLELAKRLARALLPMIANSLPVDLHFFIEPQTALADIAVTVDGMVFNSISSSVVINSGIHLITIDAPGYRHEEIRYAFSGKRSFNVRVVLTPDTPGVLLIHMNKPLSGTIYTNAINGVMVDDASPDAPVSVDGKAVIGQFTDLNNNALFFYIPASFAKDGEKLHVDAVPYDVSADIEKHRRRMYTAYSAFILSLPVSFYTYGRFVNEYNLSVLDNIQSEDAQVWQKRCWCAVGVSVTLGAVFAYQLVRYLISANSVLPISAVPDEQEKE